MRWYVVVIGILLLAAAATFLPPLYERKYRRKRMEHRPNLSDEDIFQQFYAGSEFPKKQVLDFWHQISDVFHVDAGKLRPDDNLNDLCKKRFSIFSDLDALEHFINSKIRKGNRLSEKFETIDNIIQYLLHEARRVQGG